jgi:hypothetical protein
MKITNLPILYIYITLAVDLLGADSKLPKSSYYFDLLDKLIWFVWIGWIGMLYVVGFI